MNVSSLNLLFITFFTFSTFSTFFWSLKMLVCTTVDWLRWGGWRGCRAGWGGKRTTSLAALRFRLFHCRSQKYWRQTRSQLVSWFNLLIGKMVKIVGNNRNKMKTLRFQATNIVQITIYNLFRGDVLCKSNLQPHSAQRLAFSRKYLIREIQISNFHILTTFNFYIFTTCIFANSVEQSK